jgi:hypothetical protein
MREPPLLSPLGVWTGLLVATYHVREIYVVPSTSPATLPVKADELSSFSVLIASANVTAPPSGVASSSAAPLSMVAGSEPPGNGPENVERVARGLKRARVAG